MKLEDLEVKALVAGIEPGIAVRVLDIEWAGADAVNVAYMLPSGLPLRRTLFRDDEASLAPATTSSRFTFSAPAADFKLAAEAMRIQLAHLFDPMMAVHTSDVEPLPHQIAAVYESMLPKQPLRFVLADDPGAGKTIMAGLLIRELMLRGDLERCIIVSPGSLVEQWQSELSLKFGLDFEILTQAMVESTRTGNPFRERNLLIARLDQLSRKEEWQEKLKADDAHWDLVIFDEAHKLSATWWGSELKTTKRYQLGKLLGSGDQTRNFLLMTATPHNGKDEDFQAWMALIDEDRFGGVAKNGGAGDVSDVMRRMVKEDLVRFDGTRLFLERRAETVKYTLSPAERRLYDDVTSYVREQMGRADAIEDGKKRAVVGFALTILQRRLASSPWAIAQSLKRRREKLERKIEDLRNPKPQKASSSPLDFLDAEFDADEMSAEELEEIEEIVVDEATAARTIVELDKEIAELRLLEAQAAQVLQSGIDKKWEELSSILQSDEPEMLRNDGRRRKMIVFTEHKDTLDYLKRKIRGVLGSDEAVIEIHGGTRREERLHVQDQFRQNKDVIVLIATDAAGEGVNLQVANLMVNYDLPWNPNRIEQRFGRIHRIGQTEICRMWNLVATETREGEVFDRLFMKLEEERAALGGRVFDILGQTFDDVPLKELLLKAIRYGDQPEVRQKVFEVVDGALDRQHIQELYTRNALTPDAFNAERLASVKEQMELAEAKKLQPLFLRRFLVEALEEHGAKLSEREPGRYEVKHVPAVVRQFNKVHGNRRPVLEKYERITFDRQRITEPVGKPRADLVHPAHSLMSSVIELVLREKQSSLQAGSVLIDPIDPGMTPRLLFVIDHVVREGTSMTKVASRRMHFVEIDRHGEPRNPGSAPYLNYYAPREAEQAIVAPLLTDPWLSTDLQHMAVRWATSELVGRHLTEVKELREAMAQRTLEAVHARLTREITYWSKRRNELDAEVKAGKQPKLQPENARKRVEDLKARLQRRTAELEAMKHVASNPPVVVGCALIVPQGLIDAAMVEPSAPKVKPEWPTSDPEVRRQVELIAMKAVMDAERALGQTVTDVSALKCGWDVTSRGPLGDRHIEVKGRFAEAETITVTANEVMEGINQGQKFLLAFVLVNDGTIDGPHYVRAPFTNEPDAWVASVNLELKKLRASAKPPHQA